MGTPPTEGLEYHIDMGKLITVVGTSGVGKTTLIRALAKAYPFATAYEQHEQRPFQVLFKNDARYALANQVDYFLLRAEQEKRLRSAPQTGLIDGGLDLDFYGFTRLFHSQGMLTDPEFDLCRRVYDFLRETLPPPELIVRLCAEQDIVARRLSTRDRINIARADDTALFDSFLDEWLASIPSAEILKLDVSKETLEYEQSVHIIVSEIGRLGWMIM